MSVWRPAERSDIAKMLYTQAAAKARFDQISVQQVMDAARRKTGLEDFGGEDFLPRLEVLLESINKEARLNPLGLNSSGLGMPVSMLEGRLELQNSRIFRPDIFQRDIIRPIFIVGGSRTGTTLLQRLLANEPRLRTPLLWQMS
ncbi:MAG TPA: sulfotransferase, partial [Pseudomonadales bacterium]|nr:sulfotransferase [Pseudomonadales bacterium]